MEAALRLLDVTTRVYDIDIDTEPLQSFAGRVRRYYSELAERMRQEEARPQSEDRMYM